MKTLVIANRNARSGGAVEHIERVATDELGWDWRWTEDRGEATRLARDAADHGYERVIAAGGDGTVHLVAQGLLTRENRPALGVLPIGTGNDLARTLGFSIDVDAALLELVHSERVRSIDIGVAQIGEQQRYLVNSSAAGLSGEVDRVVEADEKARWGPFAYVLGAWDVLGDLPGGYDVTVRVEDRVIEHLSCVGLTVTNGRTCGGGLRVAPDADLEDGMLDLLLVENASWVALAGVGAQLRTGGVLGNALAHAHRSASFVIESDPPMPFNVDGELLGDVRCARFATLPRVLSVFVGPGYGKPGLRERLAQLAP